MKDSISAWDIVVIGAGPAGLFAAALLAPRFSVLVVDRRPIGEGKVCAGLMSHEAHQLLCAEGEGGDMYEEPARLDLVAVIEGGTLPARPFWNVDRGALQVWMASRAEAAGAVLVRSCLRSVTKAKHAWNLTFDEGKLVLASVLIGADGAASSTRRALGFEAAPFAAARQCVVEGHVEKAYLVLDRGEGETYYCWAVPKRSGVLVGAADPMGFPERALRVLSSRIADFATGSPIAEERGMYTRVRGMGEVALGVPGAFLIGEAAGLVLPSSGEGLGGALESAAAVAKVLCEAGLSQAGLGRDGAPAVLEDYRAALAPRLSRIEKDIELYKSLSAGSL